MVKETEWNKQFRIGVDSIDNAHKKLFSIVRKLIHLSQDKENQSNPSAVFKKRSECHN